MTDQPPTTEPQTVADRYPVVTTETTLTVHRSLPELDADLRDAIRAWLRDHDLDEMQVLLGYPITRDPEKRSLSWTRNANEVLPIRVVDMAPRLAPDPWPAPFPDIVLAQSQQDCCPTCGRSL